MGSFLWSGARGAEIDRRARAAVAGVKEAGVSAAGGLASALSTHVPCHLGPVVLGLGQTLTWVISLHPVYVTAAVFTPELVKTQAVGVRPRSPSERWGQDSSPGLPGPHLALLTVGCCQIVRDCCPHY